MNRQGKFLYQNGEPAQGSLVWVRHGNNYPCPLDEFGNFRIDYEDTWVDRVLLDGEVALEDWDVAERQDFGEVRLRIMPGGGQRRGRLLHESGEPLAGVRARLLYRGDSWDVRTDDEGWFEIEYPHEWIDQVLVDGAVVREDWDIGSGELGELRITGGSGTTRSIRLMYHDGTPVSEEEVVWVYHDEKYRARTRDDGTLRIDYPHEWVDQMIVGGLEVRREWDLGGQSLLEEFSLPNPATAQKDGNLLGVAGMIFWSDGTALDRSLEVRWSDPQGYTWTSEAKGGYCRDDGTFLVPIGDEHGKEALSNGRWFVGGHEPRFTKRVGAARFFHVLPDSAPGRGSTTGGLVTGFTVDRDGHPIDGVRVRGEVRSNSFLSFLGGKGEDTEVRSDRSGGFALGFRGGGALSNIYLNGQKPSRVYVKNSAGEEIDIPIGNGIPAGSFSLYCVVPRSGFFS